jgi:hypothetical protein
MCMRLRRAGFDRRRAHNTPHLSRMTDVRAGDLCHLVLQPTLCKQGVNPMPDFHRPVWVGPDFRHLRSAFTAAMFLPRSLPRRRACARSPPGTRPRADADLPARAVVSRFSIREQVAGRPRPVIRIPGAHSLGQAVSGA